LSICQSLFLQGTSAIITPASQGHAQAILNTATPDPSPAGPPGLPPAVLADDILAFDFLGLAAKALEGQAEREQASLELSQPMADKVQEQILLLDQVT
jgi:hypothetical protein